MFTEYMTFSEIRKELERDKIYFIAKVHFHSAKVLKLMRQTRMSTYNKYFDYLSPRKNRWVYHFKVTAPRSDSFSVDHYCLFYTERSYAVIINPIELAQVFYYTSHFFKRYFQREGLERENMHEIVRSFISENPNVVTQPLKNEGKNVFSVFAQMRHGVALGYLHNDATINIIEFRTFITNDMLKGDQVELSKQLEEKFKIHVVRNAPAKK